MTTLAIDIGGTKLAAALIGADGQIRDRRELPTPASQTPEALRDALSALVSPLQAHAQRVAIASTGIIRDGSLLALNPHNLGGLLHFPLVKTLEQLTNLPTIAINDAQAAAWAEYQALEGDVTEMVFITVSTGVGGGVVSGGKRLPALAVWRGISGIRLPIHGPVCGCGRQVAWKRLLLVAALRRQRKVN
ncbi:ROK family protein [Shigella flexneri]